MVNRIIKNACIIKKKNNIRNNDNNCATRPYDVNRFDKIIELNFYKKTRLAGRFRSREKISDIVVGRESERNEDIRNVCLRAGLRDNKRDEEAFGVAVSPSSVARESSNLSWSMIHVWQTEVHGQTEDSVSEHAVFDIAMASISRTRGGKNPSSMRSYAALSAIVLMIGLSSADRIGESSLSLLITLINSLIFTCEHVSERFSTRLAYNYAERWNNAAHVNIPSDTSDLLFRERSRGILPLSLCLLFLYLDIVRNTRRIIIVIN